MKSKPLARDNSDLEDEDRIEVEASGPAIAAAKKGKTLIIAASTILTVIVFYFFFFKEDNSEKERLELVQAPKPADIAPSASGKSLFEFEEKIDKQEIDILEKPQVPDVPTLPELPKDSMMPGSLLLNDPDMQQGLQIGDLPQAGAITQDGEQNALGGKILPEPPSQKSPLNSHVRKQIRQSDGTFVEEREPVSPRYAPIIVFSGGGDTAALRGVGYESNIVRLRKNPLEDLALTESGVTATYISDRPHTIAQGKLLTAVLETAINTEIPGFVRGIVSRDVFGESGSQVLIPRGSRLFGAYTSEVLRGQGRVQIGWTRLIRPDGVDLAISFNASDQFGRAGIPGEVDNKYTSIVANSLLTSVIAVAATAVAQSLSSDTASTTTTSAAQGTTTVTADATNQAINNVSTSIVDTISQVVNNALDITPVIRVPQGTRITVIVNSDIRVPFMNGREKQ
jgi:type IV secretory pathway VirB10-like protein